MSTSINLSNIGGSSAGGSTVFTGASVRSIFSQAAHGFTTGNVVRPNTTGYGFTLALASGDPVNYDVIGIVTNIPDANSFELCTQGFVSGGWVPTGVNGVQFYLSPSTSGVLTNNPLIASGTVVKPLVSVIQPGLALVNIESYKQNFYNLDTQIITSAVANPIIDYSKSMYIVDPSQGNPGSVTIALASPASLAFSGGEITFFRPTQSTGIVRISGNINGGTGIFDLRSSGDVLGLTPAAGYTSWFVTKDSRDVFVRALASGNQSVAASSQTILDFANRTDDVIQCFGGYGNNNRNTFTAPYNGYYKFNVRFKAVDITMGAAHSAVLRIWKNVTGVAVTTSRYKNADLDSTITLSSISYFNVGDTGYCTLLHANNAPLTGSADTQLEVTRVVG